MQENIFTDWLNRRKITNDVIGEFSLGVAVHPMIGQSLTIPVLDFDGKFSFNKYRRSPLSDEKPKYLYDKGSKTTLYGWHKAKAFPKILVCEGELDSLVAWSHEIPAVSSTSGSLTFKEEWGELFKDKEVVLCFDNDEAGGEGMVKALAVIPHAKVVILPDRPGVKDITDYVQNGGDLQALLATARPYQTIEDVVADRSERISKWLSTHFHDAYIKDYRTPETKNKAVPRRETTDKVLRAKDYPIESLVAISYSKQIKCPFHADKTPSCHYYHDSNRLYCFGACGRSFDSIDVYMKLNNVTFKEAVEFLSK